MLKPETLSGAVALAAVVDHRGFAAAGRALGVSQSTVSRQVARLEQAVGVRLLARSTRSVTLTEAGRWFHERAQAGLTALTEAERGANGVGAAVEGVLRVTMPEAFGRRVVVPVLSALCRAHPRLRLELDLSDAARALDRAGFDLAVRLGRPHDDRYPGEVAIAGPLSLVCSPDLRPRPERPEDLGTVPAVLLRDPRLRSTLVFIQAGERRRVEATPTHVVSDTEAARSLTCAGLGVSLLPDWLVAEDIAAGRLVRCLPAWSAPDYPVRVIPLTPLARTRAAVGALVKALGDVN